MSHVRSGSLVSAGAGGTRGGGVLEARVVQLVGVAMHIPTFFERFSMCQ